MQKNGLPPRRNFRYTGDIPKSKKEAEKPMTYGYVRVSSRDQNEDRQLLALRAAPFPVDRLYVDHQSGKDFNRPQYKKLIRRLRPGDLLAVTSIDRLGRNYAEILEQWRKITKELHADVVVLDMPLLDTRSRERDLTGTLIADIVLQLLSYVAQTERESIRRRQAEGIAAAKLRGVRFGRPRLALGERYPELCDAYLRGEVTAVSAARELNVSNHTFVRRVLEERGTAGRDA